MAVAAASPYPASFRKDHGHGFVNDGLHHDRLAGFLDHGAARVAKGLRVRLDLPDDQLFHRGFIGEQMLKFFFLRAEFRQLLLDLDAFQARKLTQANLEDVFCLPVRQPEGLDQRRFRFVRFADDPDHAVDVQEDGTPAFEDMDAVIDLSQPESRTPGDCREAELAPLEQHILERLLARPSIVADHHHVDRRRRFHPGVCQQGRHEFLLVDFRGFRLEHQADRGILARFVAHRVKHREDQGLEVLLLGRQGFFPGTHLGIGEFLDLLKHLLGGSAVRQFGHYRLPLTAREFLDVPARAHLERATAGFIGFGDFPARTDDLAAAGEIRPLNVLQQFRRRDLRLANQRHRCLGHFPQVVRGDFGGHADRDAGSPVEQQHGQARRHLPRFLKRAIVVRNEVDRSQIDLVSEQSGNRRKPRLGVAHRGGTVAVATAEISLAIDQRVAHRKTLRQAHQRIVGGLVAVRMELAQNVAHHPRTLDGLGVCSQPHFVHRKNDAALHRLLTIGDVRQGAALDNRHRIFEIGTLGVQGERQVIGVFRKGRQGSATIGRRTAASATRR